MPDSFGYYPVEEEPRRCNLGLQKAGIAIPLIEQRGGDRKLARHLPACHRYREHCEVINTSGKTIIDGRGTHPICDFRTCLRQLHQMRFTAFAYATGRFSIWPSTASCEDAIL